MAKWHINKTSGQVGICRASKVACPVGEPGDHFPSEELAIKEYMHRDPKLAKLTEQWGYRKGTDSHDRTVAFLEKVINEPKTTSLKEDVVDHTESLSDLVVKNPGVSTFVVASNPNIVGAAGLGILITAVDSLTGGKIQRISDKLQIRYLRWDKERFKKAADRIKRKVIAHEQKEEGGLTPEQVEKGLRIFSNNVNWTSYKRGEELMKEIVQKQRYHKSFIKSDSESTKQWIEDAKILGVSPVPEQDEKSTIRKL